MDSVRTNRPPLWHNSRFVKLWLGQALSLVGSNITLLAIPLTAVSQLAATPGEMGLLNMAQFLPFLLFGLLAGVWVDRLPRRPVLIGADLGRAGALATVPLAAYTGWLSMEVLMGVAFVVGSFNVLFEAAYAAFVAELVPEQQLTDANSALHTSAAAAEVAGPGAAGWLIQQFSATTALLGDALSFVVSAAAVLAIPVRERAVPKALARPAIGAELKAGLAAVLHNPYIRPLTLCSASANIFINMHVAIYVLYLSRQLALTPSQIGLLYSVAGVCGVLGALAAGPLARRMGIGRAIIAESVAVGVAAIALPLISLLGPAALPWLAVAHGVWGFWLPVYVVNAASIRQVTTPNTLLGRVTASSRFVSWGTATIGFGLGGWIATAIGLVPTLLIAGVGILASALWVVLSPIRTLAEMPARPAASTADALEGEPDAPLSA